MTEPAPLTPGQTLRAFLRAHAKDDGALDAIDALHAIESHAGEANREAALSAALVAAQRDAQPLYRDMNINLGQGKGSFRGVSTEQRLTVGREALGKHGLMVSCTQGMKAEHQGLLFLVVEFEVRHELGGTLRAMYEWPVDFGRPNPLGAGAIEAASRTWALGYYMRDLLLLPTLPQEEAGYEQKPRASGPVKREPAPRPEIGQRARDVVTAIGTIKDAEGLNRAEMKVADLFAALESGADPGYTHGEVRAMDEACRGRRAALVPAEGSKP